MSHENTSNHEEDMSRKYRRKKNFEDKGMKMIIGDNAKLGLNSAKIGS